MPIDQPSRDEDLREAQRLTHWYESRVLELQEDVTHWKNVSLRLAIAVFAFILYEIACHWPA